MNGIQRAIALTESIREALGAEVALARDERVLIRMMDADGLNQRAAKRAEFNQKTSRLMAELGEALGSAGTDLGLTGGVTLEALQARVPVEGKRMSALLAEVRALAAALAELDALNRLLGQRALSYVRAHLSVLSPKPAAYDRRGGATSVRTSTFVKVA